MTDARDPRRPIDRWLSSYSGDHVNSTNQLIHLLCVPAIVWSVTAVMWVIPVPLALVNQGAWMAIGMFLAWAWYWRLSRPLAIGMLVVFVAFGFLNRMLWMKLGSSGLLWLALGVFVVAWIGQFVGHKIEGRKPSFLTDLSYLLVGPLWTLEKLYRKLGIRH
ncbi:Mpo1 family 2-hydroxy fatty acid dioxygenase [Arenimonas alkanexedens]